MKNSSSNCFHLRVCLVNLQVMRDTYKTVKGSASMDLAKQAKQLLAELQV